VDFECADHMDKDASLFTSLDDFVERNIYIVDDFSIDIVGKGDVSCRHGRIVDVYQVPNLNVNLLLVSQLTKTCNIVEFWLDCYFFRDLKKGCSIVIGGFLDLKDIFYKFCNTTQPNSQLTAHFSHTNKRSRTWNERMKHLNFLSLQSMENHNMVVGLPKLFPPKEVCKGCVLSNYNQTPFDFGKSW